MPSELVRLVVFGQKRSFHKHDANSALQTVQIATYTVDVFAFPASLSLSFPFSVSLSLFSYISVI